MDCTFKGSVSRQCQFNHAATVLWPSLKFACLDSLLVHFNKTCRDILVGIEHAYLNSNPAPLKGQFHGIANPFWSKYTHCRETINRLTLLVSIFDCKSGLSKLQPGNHIIVLASLWNKMFSKTVVACSWEPGKSFKDILVIWPFA